MKELEGYLNVESTDIERMFEELSQLTRKPAATMLRDRAGMLGRYFAENCHPVVGLDADDPMKDKPSGRSLEAKQLGQNAVKRDIRRVYSSPSATFKIIQERHDHKTAKAFSKMLKLGLFDEARALLQRLGLFKVNKQVLDVQGWDGGDRHRRYRNKRGRINRGTRPVIVNDGKGLRAYTKEIVKRVGWAKSGFITAAGMVSNKGLKGLPVWMRQPAPGSGTDMTNSENPAIALKNLVPYINNLMPERMIAHAQKAFEASLAKELQTLLLKIWEKGLRGLGGK